MRIVQGTFRLSIVVSIAAMALEFWEDWDRHADQIRQSLESRRAYECASRLPDERLAQFENEFGNMNIQGVGCANRPFWVAPHELNSIRNGNGDDLFAFEKFQFNGVKLASVGIIYFFAVNLTGFAVITAFKILRWIIAGFRKA